MSVKYYNGLDKILLDLPKNHVQFSDNSQKYAKINDGSNIVNPDFVDNLSQLKIEKKLAVDIKTQSLIYAGVSHLSEIFSMSETAQINWAGLEIRKAALTYPYKVTTKDDKAFSFADENALTALIDAVFTHKESLIISGRDLKVSIDACTTFAELKTVVDNR